MTLKEWLRCADVSQAEMARRIGVTQAAVSRYVAGTRLPRPRRMAQIERVTGGRVTPADFYAGQAPAAKQAAA